MKDLLVLTVLLFFSFNLTAQRKGANRKPPVEIPDTAGIGKESPPVLKWRNIGPFRGGRSVTSTGVIGNPLVYYMGTTGGGVWKTVNGGQTWFNISDGYFKTGSVGAVAVSESDPNVVYVGMGEHAPRGVMTSYGDGVYKSTDAGKTWKKIGLEKTQTIANIRIDPKNPDIVYVAAQGALYGPTSERGIYKSTNGGETWDRVLFINDNTGCVDLSMDMNNPRILYAAMWDYQRKPWEMRSGGPGSGLYKSTDAGKTWEKIEKGLPKELGKMSISVSRANSDRVYALVESDSEKEQGGLFSSDDAGKSWNLASKDHRLVQRAWYYIEVIADPQNENIVYVLNSPGLRSIDGGRTWTNIRGTHGDYHQLWINPANNKNQVISNDGGAAITFDEGRVWSTQDNQPTAQFYRVNADDLFPYNVYGGQQDNTSVMISSRNTWGYSIGEKNWFYSAGGESAFLAFDPAHPRYIMGGSYQGTVDILDRENMESKPVMVAPIQYQALQPKNMKYRFNWNAPIIYSAHEPNTFYHGGNRLFRTSDLGKSWEIVSPDLTRNDTSKMGVSGVPYTNEGAGGENYGTLAYIKESPLEKGVIWTGSDDGVVSLTRDGGKTWNAVTPAGLSECLINCIEVSPFDKATAYIATTRYKFNDYTPALYKTTDYGKSWTRINDGIPYGAYTRCIREDNVRRDLLYCGTETGFYISYNGGRNWTQLQLNLPVTPITDLKVHQGDLIASTMGRAFWILDDLNMLRQFDQLRDKKRFQFFTPENGYRVSGYSGLDNNPMSDEEEGGSAETSAANPSTGVVFYYQLPSGNDSARTLSLTILDGKGKEVRSFASTKDSDYVAFPGGPAPEPVLSNRSDLNRFVWDLRYPILPGVPTVFIEGAYEGRKVAPGNYTAVLKMDSTEKRVAFKIMADPRIDATPADYAAQQELAAQIEAGIRSIHESVLRIRKVRKQVEETAELLKKDAKYGELVTRARDIAAKLKRWEDDVVQNKAQSNDDIINFVNRISADYIFLKGQMDVNIPYVTRGQEEQFKQLDADWNKLHKLMDDLLDKDIAELNALSRKLGVERIIVPSE